MVVAETNKSFIIAFVGLTEWVERHLVCIFAGCTCIDVSQFPRATENSK